jgi:acyl-CoA reductase-like NAD-dependent aldehyde dehydrogenase
LNSNVSAIARMEGARQAQAEWAQFSVGKRCRTLRRLRSTIAAHLDEIVAVISAEVGKPPLDVLTGDILVTLEQLRFYESIAAEVLSTRSVGKPRFLFSGTRFIESQEQSC